MNSHEEIAKRDYEDTLSYMRKLRKQDKAQVARIVNDIHEDVFSNTDCLTCANCCKTSPPLVTKKDAKRIAQKINLPPKTFIKKYLIEDIDGSMMMNGVPCTFLREDNTCAIYDVRPEACRRYPHTNETDYSLRATLNTDNTVVCPAAYQINLRLQQAIPL